MFTNSTTTLYFKYIYYIKWTDVFKVTLFILATEC